MPHLTITEDEEHQLLLSQLTKLVNKVNTISMEIRENNMLLQQHMDDPKAHTDGADAPITVVEHKLNVRIEDLEAQLQQKMTEFEGRINILADRLTQQTDKAIKDIEEIVDTIVPTGTIVAFSGETLPRGYLPCDGNAISRVDYPRLFAAIGTIYGSGDGSTTFNTPNLNDRMIWGAGNKALGTYLEAGLPNIVGWWNLGNETGVDGTVVKLIATWSGARYTSSGYTRGRAGLDASRASPVYGRSDTVTPPSLVLNYIIKA